MAAPARDVKVAVSRVGSALALNPECRLQKAELKRKSWGSASTRSGSSEDSLEELLLSCKDIVLCRLSHPPPSAT